MILLTRDRISLGGFLCLSGLFCQRPVVYPTTFSVDTTSSTYDSDYAFFFLSFHFFFYFLVSLKRCCNHAHLFLKISSYLDCMPQRSSFCCLFLFLFCFLLLTNFLFHYVFYGGTEIKDTDADTITVINYQFIFKLSTQEKCAF